MSEFQYYEFQTVDRHLTSQEMEDICKLSSRARVSTNRAVFTYQFGSFRGDTEELLMKHFDAFLYVSNFGTKELSFRLPTRLLKTQNLCPYEYENIVEIEPYEDISIITLHLNNEEGGGWIEEEECADLLNELLSLRQDLLSGDPRALYLALIANQDNIREDNYIDSLPIPPNLKKLTPALQKFVEFFEITPDLFEPYASKSPDVSALPFDLTHLSEQEKTTFLQKLLDDDPYVKIDLQNVLTEKRACQQKC